MVKNSKDAAKVSRKGGSGSVPGAKKAAVVPKTEPTEHAVDAAVVLGPASGSSAGVDVGEVTEPVLRWSPSRG